MSFVLKTRLAPAGRRRAVLMGFEEIDGPYSRPALRWTWRVEGGAHDGLELVKVTGTEFRLGTALGDLLEALYGRVLKEGDAVDLAADLVGKAFDVFAVPGQGSGAVVQTIKPASEA
jgi:hypothetical protein